MPIAFPDLLAPALSSASWGYLFGAATMPQYHFVIDVTDHTYDDPVGMDFLSVEAARDYDHRVIRELKKDGFDCGAVMNITDQRGQTVHSIPFWLLS